MSSANPPHLVAVSARLVTLDSTRKGHYAGRIEVAQSLDLAQSDFLVFLLDILPVFCFTIGWMLEMASTIA